MARAYSLDLRERVVAAVVAGQSCRSVAKTFMVSVASVVKWSQRHRATGSAAAPKIGGRGPCRVGGERASSPATRSSWITSETPDALQPKQVML